VTGGEYTEKIGQMENMLARIDERLKALEGAVRELSVTLSTTYKEQVHSCHQRFVERNEFLHLQKEVEKKVSKNEVYAIRLLVYGAAGIALASVLNKIITALG
jgi:hypothetical protein